MDKIDVFDVQIPDGRQISCISYNKVTYFDLDDICKLCFDSYDLVIYPLKLIITVGLDYKTLCDRFENMEPEHEGKWGDEDDMDKEASFANLVRDRYDDDKFAILWNFSSDDDLIMRNICHESFHIAMSVCQFCNMSLGFKVGEDEHAAYIAGFAGDCVSEFINSKNTD